MPETVETEAPAAAAVGAMDRGDAAVRERVRAAVASPVLASLILAFVMAGVIIAVSGANPFSAYAEMWDGALTGNGPRTLVNRAIPIVGMGLAISIPFRAGIINLGGEGQMVVGGFAAAITAVNMPGPGALVMIIAFLAGAAAGAFWALLPALAQTRLQLPILISSLLLNEPARALTSYLTKNAFADSKATSISTEPIPAGARMPAVSWALDASATLFVILALVVIVTLFNNRMASGYQSFISGINLKFSRYGGVHVERQTIASMIGGGAIAGVVGAHLVLGQAFRFVDGDLPGTGFAWTGLLVCLLAANRAFPILIAGLFFSALQVGGLAMQRNAGVSGQLAQVLQAIVILALALRFAFVRRRKALVGDAGLGDAPPGAADVVGG